MYHKLNLPPLDLPEVWYTDKVQIESKVGGYISYYVTDEVDAQIRSMFPKDFFPAKNTCTTNRSTFKRCYTYR